MCENIRRETVKTRKDRYCFCCARFIEKGSMMYVSVNRSNDHGIYSIYTCLDCERILPDLRDDIEESDGTINENCILNDFNFSDYETWDDYYDSFE